MLPALWAPLMQESFMWTRAPRVLKTQCVPPVRVHVSMWHSLSSTWSHCHGLFQCLLGAKGRSR